MSDHRGPLVPHPERRNVWTRETSAPGYATGMRVKVAGGTRYWYGTVTDVDPNWVWVLRDGEWDSESIWSVPRAFRREELSSVSRSGTPAWQPLDGASEMGAGFLELVLTWVGIFLSGWLSFLVAHAAMEIALRTVGLQRSALVAACLGAIVGAVAWLVGRRRQG